MYLLLFASDFREVLLFSPIGSPRTSKLYRKQFMMDRIKEKDGNLYVLTGQRDLIYRTNIREGFEIAHIISRSIINTTVNARQFIKALLNWLLDNFFINNSTCENDLLLNHSAHNPFDNFE